VITGPSGAGKGTLERALLARIPELELAISATTRERRPTEEDGREYHFLSPADFERRVAAGDFLEHAEYAGNRYGTLRGEVEDGPVVLEIEVQGARQVREALPDTVQVFIAPPSRDALRARLIGRGTDDPEQVERRLQTAEGELAAQDEFTRVVVNDRLEDAVDELERIVRDSMRAHGGDQASG
jgi:guanylate kinase